MNWWVPAPGPSWKAIGTGDYDGDGHFDRKKKLIDPK
jgi:hypothetical protein